MKSVADFVEQCLAYEQYAFTRDELTAAVAKSDTALRHEMSRLARKKEIIVLRRGFLRLPTYRTGRCSAQADAKKDSHARPC